MHGLVYLTSERNKYKPSGCNGDRLGVDIVQKHAQVEGHAFANKDGHTSHREEEATDVDDYLTLLEVPFGSLAASWIISLMAVISRRRSALTKDLLKSQVPRTSLGSNRKVFEMKTGDQALNF